MRRQTRVFRITLEICIVLLRVLANARQFFIHRKLTRAFFRFARDKHRIYRALRQYI